MSAPDSRHLRSVRRWFGACNYMCNSARHKTNANYENLVYYFIKKSF